MVKIRLEPSDEYMHPLETASNFNESMYFNAYDPARKVGGFLRLGNRANEGYAELTTCLYLPEDRKSTRLNSSHVRISYAVFCLKKKKKQHHTTYDLNPKQQTCV